jgi:hypothetical protein
MFHIDQIHLQHISDMEICNIKSNSVSEVRFQVPSKGYNWHLQVYPIDMTVISMKAER